MMLNDITHTDGQSWATIVSDDWKTLGCNHKSHGVSTVPPTSDLEPDGSYSLDFRISQQLPRKTTPVSGYGLVVLVLEKSRQAGETRSNSGICHHSLMVIHAMPG